MIAGRSWNRVRLGDIIRVKHGWSFKSEFFSEDLTGRPIVVAVGNFRYSGGFRFESTKTKEYRGEYAGEYELSPGDILLVMTCQTSGGEILGIPARVPGDGRVYLHNQRLGKVELLDPAVVDDGYLYWLFLWPDLNRELYWTSSGTKILHTAPTRIEAFEFELPPISEQRAIARILGALDDKIELNREMDRTLEAMAQAIFKSWFVDFDPVVAKAAGRQPFGMDAETAALFPDGLVDSEFGQIPNGFRVQPVYDVAEYVNGGAFRGRDFSEANLGLPVAKIAELKSGITAQTKFTIKDHDPKYRIDSGDLLFSWSGSPDTSIDTFVWTLGPAWLNQHIFRVVPKEPYDRAFVYSLLKHLKPQFIAIARDKQTTGLGHVTVRDLKAFMVSTPPREALSAFAAFVGPLYERMYVCMMASHRLASLRDTLLPKLLSGEIRVGQAEKAVEEVL